MRPSCGWFWASTVTYPREPVTFIRLLYAVSMRAISRRFCRLVTARQNSLTVESEGSTPLVPKRLNWTHMYRPRAELTHEFAFWDNWAVATMTVSMGKSIVSYKNHICPSLYCEWSALSNFCFPSKRHASLTHVNIFLSFGLGFVRKETTKTHSDLKRPPTQQW
jgi:hypothetical protein